ncbi:MAG: GntR family transcriptional regulator [Planctomycetota bacterium]
MTRNATIDRAAAEPLHAQVERALRDMIREPALARGGLLPDELTLARRFSVSRGTLREAIKRLVAEGLLERRAGVGTRVVHGQGRGRVETALSAWPSFSSEMAAQGRPVVEHKVTRRWVAATRRAAEALEIEPGRRLTRIDRLRGIGAGPAVWFCSWFTPALGRLDDLATDRPLYQELERLTGYRPARSEETLWAKPAGARIARELGIDPKAAVLMRERRVRDASGRPLEFAINAYRSDVFKYRTTLVEAPR